MAPLNVHRSLLVAALVCFVVSALGVDIPRINLTALGLAFVTLAELGF